MRAQHAQGRGGRARRTAGRRRGRPARRRACGRPARRRRRCRRAAPRRPRPARAPAPGTAPRPGRGDDPPGPRGPGELDGGLPDHAPGAQHQHPLPRRQAAAEGQRHPGRHGREPERRDQHRVRARRRARRRRLRRPRRRRACCRRPAACPRVVANQTGRALRQVRRCPPGPARRPARRARTASTAPRSTRCPRRTAGPAGRSAPRTRRPAPRPRRGSARGARRAPQASRGLSMQGRTHHGPLRGPGLGAHRAVVQVDRQEDRRSPTGWRSSSASWPISPAVRASSANPRSSGSGRPRSASAAPHTPAPLSGSVLPSTCGCTRPIAANSAQVRPEQPLLAGDLHQPRACAGRRPCARGGRGRGRTARPPAARARSPGPGRPSRRRRSGSSSTPASTSCRNRPRVLGDAEEARAPAEQPGGERALDRVGRGQVGQPGDDRGRGEAVVGQRGEHRLEHPHLAGRRAAAGWPARTPARRTRPRPSRRAPGRGPSRVIVVAGRGAQRRRVVVCAPSRRRQPLRAARRRARPAPAAAARSRAGVAENVIGCRAIGTARSPSPTSTTGSSPNCSAIANPPSIVLIGPHGTPGVDQQLEPLVGAAGREPLDEDRLQLGPVRGAVAVAAEPRVVGDLGDAERRRTACGTGGRWPRR